MTKKSGSDTTIRYRGLDIDEDEDNVSLSATATCSQHTCEECTSKIEELQLIIKQLQKQLCDDEDARQTKKRRRIGSDETADANAENLELAQLAAENKTLKEKLKAVAHKLAESEEKHRQMKSKAESEVKASETKKARILPNSTNTPLPNISVMFNQMQETVTKQINEMKKSIETSIDSKITAFKDEVSTAPKSSKKVTFASMVSGESSSTPVTKPVDFRALMRTTRNEEINEERDKEKRKANIVVHGCETSDQEQTEEKIKMLLKDVGADAVEIKKISRIGKLDNNKRPILVEFSSEHDKDLLMRSLRNLKGNTEYNGISITDDYTLSQREMINDYRKEVKEMNSKNENSEYFYCVRGTPKNGLFIKKMKKTATTEQQ